MFTYEAKSKSLESAIKNTLISSVIVIKQLLRTRSMYYYSNGNDHVFLNEFAYLYKYDAALEKVSEGSFDVFCSEKIGVYEQNPEIFKFKYQPFKLFSQVLNEGRNKGQPIHAILAVLRSSLKYSFIFDRKFVTLQCEFTERYKAAIISDPANPLSRSFSSLRRLNIKYACTTSITEHSIEWGDIQSKQIYVIGNKQLNEDFLKHQGKIVNFIPVTVSTACSSSYKFRILFLQQYFHSLAFSNRLTHFVLNCNLAMKPNVLTRLHPNEAAPEKLI